MHNDILKNGHSKASKVKLYDNSRAQIEVFYIRASVFSCDLGVWWELFGVTECPTLLVGGSKLPLTTPVILLNWLHYPSDTQRRFIPYPDPYNHTEHSGSVHTSNGSSLNGPSACAVTSPIDPQLSTPM